MDPAEHKSSHQQCGHSPECVEEEGISPGIVVSCVGEIAGESTGGAGVALSTGRNYVGATQMRTWVADCSDIVSSVAVVTLRSFGVTQAGYFAVIRVEICFRDLAVTAAATIHDFEFERLLIGTRDLMCRVAIAANRKRLIRLCHAGGVHALIELLLDSVVALSAGIRQVARIHRGFRIDFWQDTVRGVTTGASRSHGESALQQSLPVNAFFIVGDDLVLGTGVAQRRFLTFTMATPAQVRYVGRKYGRRRIVSLQYAMGSVAVFAGRRILVVLSQQLTVLAALELLADFLVTRAAINSPGNGFAGTNMRGVDLGVALAARDFCVSRTSDFLHLDEHRSAIAALETLVGVAAHAIRIRHSLRVIDLSDLVRLVAINAGWKNVRFLFPEFAPNGLAMHSFDLRVTLGAGCRDVPSRN